MNTIDEWFDDAKGKISFLRRNFNHVEFEVRTQDKIVALIELIRKIQKRVDDQAEDEGLWCCTTRIAEAYLQQELRKLHREIEDGIGDLK